MGGERHLAAREQTSHANPLPPALRALLPVLAADQGRARARTLLFLADVGPDAVDLTIAGLDAALGMLGSSRLPATPRSRAAFHRFLTVVVLADPLFWAPAIKSALP